MSQWPQYVYSLTTKTRNWLRHELGRDPVFAHQWLCHPNGEVCPDGCDIRADSERVAFYHSEMETVPAE